MCAWRPLPCEVVGQAAHQLAHAVLAGPQGPALQVQQEVILGRRVERDRLVGAARQTHARQLLSQSESRERERASDTAVRRVAESYDCLDVFLNNYHPDIRNQNEMRIRDN